MVSLEQVHHILMAEIRSEKQNGQLAYILQPIREYDRDSDLVGVARWLLAMDNPSAQFAGEVLLRLVETRREMDKAT